MRQKGMRPMISLTIWAEPSHIAKPHEPGWKREGFIFAWLVQLMKQTGAVPVVGAVPPENVEPYSWLYALSRQPQQPPAFAGGAGNPLGVTGTRLPPWQAQLAIFFTPRTHRSGRPPSSAQKMVVDVPSVIMSIDVGP